MQQIRGRKGRLVYRTTLYLDYEVVEKLKEIAHREQTNLTELINQILSQYLQSLKKEGEESTQ